MSITYIFFLAIALAMDSFAVSITEGIKMPAFKPGNATIIAFFMGLFQALMPLAGWLLGNRCLVWVEKWDHWIAFGLLLFLGVKMIMDSFSSEVVTQIKSYHLKINQLFMMSIATSIDAFAVGIGLGLLQTAIYHTVIIIGLVTYVLSFAGVYIGHRFAKSQKWNVQLFGGLLLIGIGVKILISHLAA